MAIHAESSFVNDDFLASNLIFDLPQPNPRGASCGFGKDVVQEFCEKNDIDLVLDLWFLIFDL